MPRRPSPLLASVLSLAGLSAGAAAAEEPTEDPFTFDPDTDPQVEVDDDPDHVVGVGELIGEGYEVAAAFLDAIKDGHIDPNEALELCDEAADALRAVADTKVGHKVPVLRITLRALAAAADSVAADVADLAAAGQE